MSRERPPLLLRLAVVVGAFTLLLGVAGIVLMLLQDDDSSAAGRGLSERVRVVGVPEDVALTVVARWEDGPLVHTEAAKPLTSEVHVFLLPPELAGRDVVLEVRDTETERLLATRDLRVDREQEIRIDVEPTAER